MTTQLKHLISPYQHGFIRGRSTNTNLLEFTNFAINNIESGLKVYVMYTDLKKAFDLSNSSFF